MFIETIKQQQTLRLFLPYPSAHNQYKDLLMTLETLNSTAKNLLGYTRGKRHETYRIQRQNSQEANPKIYDWMQLGNMQAARAL
eukprot:m.195741 g.195741  ORF g.195741 m.195741 type:complete len:84 (+) comp15692_c0_seq13:2066-2317(+)